MQVPHINDAAFVHAIQRIGTLLDMIAPGATPDEVQASTSNFYRALGLDGEYDDRALDLSAVVMGHLRHIDPSEVPPDDVSMAVLGIMLGLLLAEGSGWEPPIRKAAGVE